MDFEYIIDNGLTNSLIRSLIGISGFFGLKYFVNDPMLKVIEKELWKPKFCLINMKNNVRWTFSIGMSIFSVWLIKEGYFYLNSKRKENNFSYMDYSVIGIFSGMLCFYLIFSKKLPFLFFGALNGLFFSNFYCFTMRHTINQRKRKAELLGINI